MLWGQGVGVVAGCWCCELAVRVVKRGVLGAANVSVFRIVKMNQDQELFLCLLRYIEAHRGLHHCQVCSLFS